MRVSATDPLVEPAHRRSSEPETLRAEPYHGYPSAVYLTPLVLDGVALLIGTVVVGQNVAVGWANAAFAFALLTGGCGCRGRINPRLGDDLPRLLGLLALPVLLLTPLFPPSEIEELASAWPVVAGLVLIGRAASYSLIRILRSRGLVVEPTLVVGTGRLGLKMATTLREHPEYGLKPVGF